MLHSPIGNASLTRCWNIQCLILFWVTIITPFLRFIEPCPVFLCLSLVRTFCAGNWKDTFRALQAITNTTWGLATAHHSCPKILRTNNHLLRLEYVFFLFISTPWLKSLFEDVSGSIFASVPTQFFTSLFPSRAAADTKLFEAEKGFESRIAGVLVCACKPLSLWGP